MTSLRKSTHSLMISQRVLNMRCKDLEEELHSLKKKLKVKESQRKRHKNFLKKKEKNIIVLINNLMILRHKVNISLNKKKGID